MYNTGVYKYMWSIYKATFENHRKQLGEFDPQPQKKILSESR